MRSKFTRLATSVLSLAGTAALFCGLTTTAHAQFQMVAGGGSEDAAQGGVIPYYDEGTITVGHSSSFGNDQDVYVVMTDLCGNVRWARTYDFGGADIGRKIRYNKRRDAFIIVGSTDNKFSDCTQREAFLMEIDRNGNPNWSRTYGGKRDDQGNDVRVSRDGDFYYFAGQTSSFTKAGDYDAWLTGVRSDDGQLGWSRTYGEPKWQQDDGFNALDLGCGDNTIIAAGYTRNYTRGSDMDILVAKVYDYNGDLAGSGTLWHYGSGKDEAANSIVNFYNKIFYVAGYTSEYGGNLAYVMGGYCDNGEVYVDKVYGDPARGGDNQFTEVQISGDGQGIALTGFVQDYLFGGYDVLLAELNIPLDPMGFGFGIYGADRDEQGWSVTLAPGVDGDYNYVMAGFTDDFGIFGDRDLYQIRTDRNADSRCYWERGDLWQERPGFRLIQEKVKVPYLDLGCEVRPEIRENAEGQILCSVCFERDQEQDGNELSQDVKSAPATVHTALLSLPTGAAK